MNLTSLSYWCDGNQDRQDVPECPDSDDCDVEEVKESPSGTNNEKEEEVINVMLGRCAPAAECPPLTIVEEIEEMFVRVGFSQMVAQKLVDD